MELRRTISWKLTTTGNSVLEIEGQPFYVSWNPGGFSLIDPDTNKGETALVWDPPDGKPIFYILNGDFRKECEEVIDLGWESCKEVFNKYKDSFQSSWCTKE